MKKEYIKPEMDLIDLTSTERVMNLDDEYAFFGDKPYLDADLQLSANFWEE